MKEKTLLEVLLGNDGLMWRRKIVTEIDHVATGAMMRDCRYKAGITLREAARRMKLSAPYLSDLERGNRKWTKKRFDEFKKALTSDAT